MGNFKVLRIWKKGMEIATKTFDLVKDFPNDERYGLSRQMTKCAISIPSNIAEGVSRSSIKDNSRFLEISLGSAFELETQLIIADNVNYGDKKKRADLLIEIIDEQKMIAGFKEKINETP